MVSLQTSEGGSTASPLSTSVIFTGWFAATTTYLRISLLWNTLWLVLIYHLCKQNWEPVVFANNEIFKEFQTRGNIMPQPAYLLYLCLFGLTLMRTFRQPPPRCRVEQIVCKWVFNSYFVINHTFLVIILWMLWIHVEGVVLEPDFDWLLCAARDPIELLLLLEK